MYKIERMKIQDYQEIISLWENTDGIGLTGKDDSKKSIKKFLKKNPHTCFVVKHKSKEIVGTIMAGNDGRRGHIYHLTVKPEYRKKGLGKKMLEKVEKRLHKDGISRAFLVAFKNNSVGNLFWDNVGYTIRADLHYRNKDLVKNTV